MRKFTLFLLDGLLLYLGLLAMLQFRYGPRAGEEYSVHIIPFLIVFALWLIIFYITGLYDIRTFRNNFYFFSAFVRAVLTASAISIAFFYLIPIFGITPKANLAVFIVFFGVMDLAARSIFNAIIKTRLKKITLLIGRGEQIKETAALIADHPQLGYELAGIVDPEALDNLQTLIETKHVDTIVVSPEAYQTSRMIDSFYKILGKQIAFYNVSAFYERIFGRVPPGAINQIWFLENMTRNSNRAYEIVKRLGDIVFGFIFGLIALPFCIIIAIAIKLSSDGPIFYTQTRIGRLGKSFTMIKFRSMVPNAEAHTGAVWASADDHRVTSLGRFLRRTRLDELPQFWSVVKGDLSLVGPRAERPEFHEILKKEIPFYEERYLITPGLSGWAQINYSYGSSVHDAAQKLQYDLYYIKNRSIVLDVGIILQTIGIVIAQAGN